MTRWLYIIFICLFIAGCSKNFKSKVGLVTTGPDEYQVQKNKPLEMPPSYLLQEVPSTAENKAD